VPGTQIVTVVNSVLTLFAGPGSTTSATWFAASDVSETVALALLPDQPPEAVQDVEFVELQVSVELCPLATDVGLALRVTVGAGVCDKVLDPPPPPQEINASVEAANIPRCAARSMPRITAGPAQ
jgi:hypothetical protein